MKLVRLAAYTWLLALWAVSIVFVTLMMKDAWGGWSVPLIFWITVVAFCVVVSDCLSDLF